MHASLYDIKSTLRKIDMFRHFNQTQLEEFSSNIREERLKPCTTLVEESQPYASVYILLEGELLVSKRTKRASDKRYELNNYQRLNMAQNARLKPNTRELVLVKLLAVDFIGSTGSSISRFSIKTGRTSAVVWKLLPSFVRKFDDKPHFKYLALYLAKKESSFEALEARQVNLQRLLTNPAGHGIEHESSQHKAPRPILKNSFMARPKAEPRFKIRSKSFQADARKQSSAFKEKENTFIAQPTAGQLKFKDPFQKPNIAAIKATISSTKKTVAKYGFMSRLFRKTKQKLQSAQESSFNVESGTVFVDGII